MPTAPDLLNDDGSASMATALLMSHHGFRRDLARFAIALPRVLAGDRSKAEALAAEWKRFHDTLHGHHNAEDQGLFPHVAAQHAELAAVIAGLTADHRRIDPLLDQGDEAFADIGAKAGNAAAVVTELATLLDAHLATEEAHVVPFIRAAKGFPPPATDAEVALYADGFAWASDGIAPEVLAKLDAMLPETVTAKLPGARAAFAERRLRVWGSTPTGASLTAVPDWLAAK